MTTRVVRGTRAVRVPWHAVALGLVLALAATLNLWRLDRNGWGNAYYAGAVRSMLGGGGDLLFASFDPGGLVAVDKTPLALWVQAGSAWLFGYSGMALLVPEALMGVASVGVLYVLVAGRWGRVAGLLAALALAVCPVFVAVSRADNPDALFILLLLCAVLAGTRAAASGRLRTLALCGALVGLAFLTKMLLAAVVLPGLVAAYLLTAPHPLGTRLRHVATAAAVMVASCTSSGAAAGSRASHRSSPSPASRAARRCGGGCAGSRAAAAASPARAWPWRWARCSWRPPRGRRAPVPGR